MTTVSRNDHTKGKTNWERVDRLSDAEIAKAVRDDPDAVPLNVDWSKAVLVTPRKNKEKA